MPDPELPEDVREVPLDRAVGQVQRGGDLAVRPPLGDERGDALLRRRQRSDRGRATADPLELRLRALRPEPSTDSLEEHERLLERPPSLAPSLRASLCGAERDERAPAVQWEIARGVQLECVRVRLEGGVELAGLRGEQAAAPETARERRCTLEPTRVALVPVEQLGRVLTAAELDQRLDPVDDEAHRARFPESLAANVVDDRRELGTRRLRVPERQLQRTEGGR